MSLAPVASGETSVFRVTGRLTGLSALTIGATYYIGPAGTLVTAPPVNARAIGSAITATSLMLTVVESVQAAQLIGTLPAAVQANITQLGVLSTGLSIAALEKLYLDGGGNTYLHESAADQLALVVGGATRLTLNASGVIVPSTIPLYLDGGADTYVNVNPATTLRVVIGGVLAATITPTAMSLAGLVQATLQPGFLAYNSVTVGPSLLHDPVQFDVAEYNTAGVYNTTTDTLTIAVAGKYLLAVNVQLQNATALANLAYVKIAIAGPSARSYDVGAVTLAANAFGSCGGTVIADLVAGHTVKIIVASSGAVNVVGSATAPTTFSAVLI
jgi:hypothetical protein